MLPLVLIYLALVSIFLAAGVGTWILRGRGFAEFRRSKVDRDEANRP